MRDPVCYYSVSQETRLRHHDTPLPECAKPCWGQKEMKAPCDPNQKACYCEPGSTVPYQVSSCIIDKCTNELDRDRAIVDASETCE